MDEVNWDDEDLPGRPSLDEEEDLFEFSSALRIDDDDAPPEDELPPLPPGAEDVFGDRGVVLKRTRSAANGANGAGSSSGTPAPELVAPSKDNPHVELHYEGFLASSGEKFDSSREQGYAMIVRLDLPPSGQSSLIAGWEAALPRMRAGETATLSIAARYAYGKKGSPPDIPPDADLRFEIEVLDVRDTHKRVVKVDHTKTDLSRLEEVRREREVAQARREEEEANKKQEKEVKVDRAALLREKLANKHMNQGKKGKKGKKKK